MALENKPTTPKGPGTILVVDDEETVLTMTRRMLEMKGFKVFVAGDGEEGIEVFKAHVDEIDWVIMDLTMPNMDGDEAFFALRRIREDVRVILSSGFSEEDLNERFDGAGVAGFIQKPYKIEDLMVKLASN